MDADRNGDLVPLGDCDRFPAVIEVLADRYQRRDSGVASTRDDGVAIGIEPLIVDMAMRIDHDGAANSIFGKSGAAIAVWVSGGSPSQPCSDVDQSSSIRP